MPTGYNEKVLDGTMGFRDYALRCAHAFVWETRDMSIDSDLPEPSHYDHDEKRLADIRKELAEKRAWTKEQWEADELRTRNEVNRHLTEAAAERLKTRANVERVLAQVYAYTPPTEEHEALKKFMIEQLEMAFQYEARGFDARWDTPISKRDIETYRQERIEQLESMEKRYAIDAEAAKERYEANKRWREALMESLEGAE
jgi:hypothetical protein